MNEIGINLSTLHYTGWVYFPLFQRTVLASKQWPPTNRHLHIFGVLAHFFLFSIRLFSFFLSLFSKVTKKVNPDFTFDFIDDNLGVTKLVNLENKLFSNRRKIQIQT